MAENWLTLAAEEFGWTVDVDDLPRFVCVGMRDMTIEVTFGPTGRVTSSIFRTATEGYQFSGGREEILKSLARYGERI